MKLIVALDSSSTGVVDVLGDRVDIYKIGLPLFLSHPNSIDELLNKDKRIFLDLKLYDIPYTVSETVNIVEDKGVEFLTVYYKSVAYAVNNSLKILSVINLTSENPVDIIPLVKQSIEDGASGIIIPGCRAKDVRYILKDKLIISPGIRDDGDCENDQRQVISPKEAFTNGVDYIVVGRPITQSKDPITKVEQFL